MRNFLHDGGHLVRLALVLVAGVFVFLLLQQIFVPPGFGRYGHYRAPVVEENAARPLRFAGQAVCVTCHEEEAKTRAAGKHAGVSCEACHGPLFAHSEDPSAVKPKLPAATALCKRCHEADAAKPKGFPQVNAEEHSGGSACDTCHQPHSPKL